MNNNTKQVIVVRKDLNMRKGKIAAQVSHASMAFITKGLQLKLDYNSEYNPIPDWIFDNYFTGTEYQAKAINEWLNNSFAKIVVYVNSEKELLDLQQKANEFNIINHLITDNGATEFNGVPTITCLAVGPDYNEVINLITGHLPLL